MLRGARQTLGIFVDLALRVSVAARPARPARPAGTSAWVRGLAWAILVVAVALASMPEKQERADWAQRPDHESVRKSA